MLKILMTTTCLALLAGTWASSAESATLGLPIKPNPEITGTGSASNFPGLFGFNFSAAGGTSSAPATAANLSISLTADITENGMFAGFGALNVGSTPDGLFLGGLLSDVGFEIDPLGNDTLEFLFGDLTGGAASEFGPRALAVVTGEFGSSIPDLFASGFDSASADIRINAVIPLPAALPLFATSFVLLGAVSARRRAMSTPSRQEQA